MNLLISIVITALIAAAAPAAEPVKLAARGEEEWQQPVYDPTGAYLAFTNASQREIWVLDRKTGKTRVVVQGSKPGRRYCFEPGGQRLVFRQAAPADPEHSERLLSTDLWTYDPVPRTHNRGPSFGPYLISNKLWYRSALTGPLLDVDDSARTATGYLDRASGKAWAIGTSGDTLYRSGPSDVVVGMELSPDGNGVALITSQPQVNLIVVSLTGGGVSRINKAGNPGWSGNSRALAYVTYGDDGHANSVRIWDVSSSTSRATPVPPLCGPSDPALNADGTRLAYVSGGELYEVLLTP
jgi:Tol biopolymer transport system component